RERRGCRCDEITRNRREDARSRQSDRDTRTLLQDRADQQDASRGCTSILRTPRLAPLASRIFAGARLAAPLAGGFARAHRFRGRYDQPRFLASALLFLGNDAAELRTDEGLKKGKALEIRALTDFGRRCGRPSCLLPPSALEHVVGGVFQPPA